MTDYKREYGRERLWRRYAEDKVREQEESKRRIFRMAGLRIRELIGRNQILESELSRMRFELNKKENSHAR